MSQNNALEIRFANESDYDTLAAIAAQACINDPMDAFHHPQRSQYASAYADFYRQKVFFYADEPNTWIIVATTRSYSPEEDPTDQIVGWAHWCREGPEIISDLPPKEPLPSLRRLSHWFESFKVANLLHDVLNPATSLYAGLQFDRSPTSEKLDAAHATFREPASYWQLEKLAVAPEAQRRGVGTALCQWGMERARDERLMVLLEATEVGRGLYDKLGFEKYGVWQWGKEKHMFEVMMRWVPRDEEGENLIK